MNNIIDEKIHIEDYNPEWPFLYEKEKELIASKLGDWIRGIEHFGSTSVPNLAAKPIIDILIGVDSLNLDDKALSDLSELGYEGLGEAGVPGRLHFRKRKPNSFNLAIVLYNGDLWKNNIILRDYLRANPDEAEKYGEIKEAIFLKGIDTLLAYSDQKSSYVLELLDKAKTWKRKM